LGAYLSRAPPWARTRSCSSPKEKQLRQSVIIYTTQTPCLLLYYANTVTIYTTQTPCSLCKRSTDRLLGVYLSRAQARDWIRSCSSPKEKQLRYCLIIHTMKISCSLLYRYICIHLCLSISSKALFLTHSLTQSLSLSLTLS